MSGYVSKVQRWMCRLVHGFDTQKPRKDRGLWIVRETCFLRVLTQGREFLDRFLDHGRVTQLEESEAHDLGHFGGWCSRLVDVGVLVIVQIDECLLLCN